MQWEKPVFLHFVLFHALEQITNDWGEEPGYEFSPRWVYPAVRSELIPCHLTSGSRIGVVKSGIANLSASCCQYQSQDAPGHRKRFIPNWDSEAICVEEKIEYFADMW